MKTLRIILLVAVAMLTAMGTSAKVWRVNSKTNSGAQYHSIADVLEASGFAEGDTILCDPGDYGNVELTIPNITLMGPGHDLYNTNSAVFGDVALATGCNAEGLRANCIYVPSDCKVSRCYTDQIIGYITYGDPWAENCTIINCRAIYLSNFRSSFITNCIISEMMSSLTACDVVNNTVYSYGTTNPTVTAFSNCVVKDNIFIQGYNYACMNFSQMAENNNAVSYCIFNTPVEDASDIYKVGNKFGATVEDTFVWHANVNNGYMEDESDLMLKEGSLAKGAASHGGDCGAFGGVFPYQATGVPRNMPRILDAAVPATPTDGTLNVTLTITTQNE